MTSPTPYQLLPRLSDGEYHALRDDIRENGVRVPIDVDEDGTVLDGHHRSWIAAQLGVPVPRRVVSGLDTQGKRNHARAVNVIRRQLTKDARLDQVRQMREEGQTIQVISTTLGIPTSTVGRDLNAISQMGNGNEQLVITNSKGIERPATYKTVESPSVVFKESDLAFLNAPSEAFHFGTIDMNRESVGPADIRSALAFLTSGETRLENIGREVGLITTWIPKESRESREQIACIIVPPAVKAVATLSALLFESGLLDMFQTLPSNERAHTMQVLTASAINLTNACEAFNRLNEKNN
ncbi:MAG: ParB N-terminal domain-containing protein [Actinomycetales bacterium]|nr:ParB N-terminal domain-containing protein [Actinomycetales bacterium]